MRAAIVIRSLLFSFVLLAFSHGAFAQIGVSVNFGPRHFPSTNSQSAPPTATYGLPVTGPMTTTVATTGYPARGSSLLKSASSGPQVIGAGAAARSFFMKDIGARRWVTMAASITATATAVLDMRAAAGKVVTSPTTLM